MQEDRVIAQRYRLGARLGEGGMGAVYEARHLVTGRRFAIKVLDRREHWPAEAIARFEREAQAPAEIGHANLVDVFDAGTDDDGTPFLVMELLEGETLGDYLRRERVVPPQTLARWMNELLSALDAMHARGFVHRDLKPANVFLARDAGGGVRVKLLDLGITKALGEEGATRSGYVIGTPAYMAPEQMRSAKSATPRSDLWSVGVLLYECALGHRPFRGETFALLAQISGPRPAVPVREANPALPEPFAALVDALLSKDPARRPASAVEVRERLERALQECPRFEPVAPPDLDPPDDAEGFAPTGEAGGAPRASLEQGATRPQRAHRAEGPSRDEGAGASVERAPPSRRGVGVAVSAVVALGAVGLMAWRVATATGARPGPDPRANTASASAWPLASGAGAVRSNAELLELLQRWTGAVTAAQGRGAVGDFYAPAVKFRGGDELAAPSAIQRYWQHLFSEGGSFGVDLDRSTVSERAADLNAGVAAACINLEGASGRVLEVRAHAVETVVNRSRDIGCPRLEGVYLLRLRRSQGRLKICHETWSLREGVCASCPTAPVCASAAPSGGAP